jgi:outer membrane protein OmpA-like peptidoglycan-associated protein
VTGCPKKTAVKEEPSVSKAEEAAAGQERAAKLEAERKEREAREREVARIREEKTKKAQEAKEAQAQKEFEKSLVAKRTPGIEGEVLGTKLLKDIHFDFDRCDVRPEDALILKGDADLLKKYPTVRIQIEGHCDERGTDKYNLALGERRANSAREYLISLGIAESRISIISYGEERGRELNLQGEKEREKESWKKERETISVQRSSE